MTDDDSASFDEQRRSLRLDMEAEPVRLNWLDANEQAHASEGLCLNIGRRGMLLCMQHPLSLGQLVYITLSPHTERENNLRGQVGRCSAEGSCHFRIALQLF
ncbi:PilZ domain-containing protein [Shewanella salipaludis]|uniref:PilZ domain-containing protein n=1 Tax=Shewanella salipaludis TaxID=2723052 RepID=A0A972FQP9_9GAMM|nr:PilZ domain-containing protein [Shewanella salipaludis]NMH64390.1 PilZ domain-containing protein [Shewanella salipaludis]